MTDILNKLNQVEDGKPASVVEAIQKPPKLQKTLEKSTEVSNHQDTQKNAPESSVGVIPAIVETPKTKEPESISEDADDDANPSPVVEKTVDDVRCLLPFGYHLVSRVEIKKGNSVDVTVTLLNENKRKIGTKKWNFTDRKRKDSESYSLLVWSNLVSGETFFYRIPELGRIVKGITIKTLKPILEKAHEEWTGDSSPEGKEALRLVGNMITQKEIAVAGGDRPELNRILVDYEIEPGKDDPKRISKIYMAGKR